MVHHLMGDKAEKNSSGELAPEIAVRSCLAFDSHFKK